jgi:hypothetical protein
MVDNQDERGKQEKYYLFKMLYYQQGHVVRSEFRFQDKNNQTSNVLKFALKFF